MANARPVLCLAKAMLSDLADVLDRPEADAPLAGGSGR
jgi:hypothetical protein